MKIRSQTLTALQALLDLCLHAPSAAPAPLADVARRQSLSPGYLEQLFRPLKKEGLVEPWRGTRGGYSLARPASEISLLDVFRAMDEPAVRPLRAGEQDGPERHALVDVLQGLDKDLEKSLAAISLEELKRQAMEKPGFSSAPSTAARFSI